MVATLYLLGCVLAPAQTGKPIGLPPLPDRPSTVPASAVSSPPIARAAASGDWSLGLHLSRAQELFYRGTFTEESLGGQVQFSRAYRVETRVLVLDTDVKGSSVAFLTVVRPKDAKPAATVSAEPSPASVRLERGKVDPQGKIKLEGNASVVVPLQGPPALECGAFVELPLRRVGLEQPWDDGEDGRPTRTWKIVGTEMRCGINCLKLVGVQQSDDWPLDRARGDRAAWRRTDTVWLAPKSGYACEVERVIERRDAGRSEPTEKSTMAYKLESSMQYPGQLFADRVRDVTQAKAFAETASPWMEMPTRFTAQISNLLGRIDRHLEDQTPTPYRDAVVQVKKRVEAAKRGELPPPALPPDEEPASAPVASVGHPAPDFLAQELTGTGKGRLRQWHGSPILLVFYSPASQSASDLLRYVQAQADTHAGKLQVVGLAVNDDAKAVAQLHSQLRLNFPVLAGSSLRNTYGVEATPRLVVIDAKGTVRGLYLGWGGETRAGVVEDLKKCLANTKP